MSAISETQKFTAGNVGTEQAVEAPPFWPGFLLCIAVTSMSVGIMWDISWHETIGRDTFWTPAHMAVYFGGVLGGCVGGWLAIQHTFLAGPEGRNSGVQVFGASAPLGAWLAIWGALAMITSAPFDNWWHNAYGLDVKIISPPHALLGLGMFAIDLGALLAVLTRQNRLQDGRGSGLFVYMGGIFVVMAGVFVMEYVFPNQQHGAMFYEVCAFIFPVRLATVGCAGRTSWPATKMSLVYLLFVGSLVWMLPLFPAEPKLAPIFNHVTHMVPPPFPLLLVFPAIAVDLILRKTGEVTGWNRAGLALVLGLAFLVAFLPVQWFFADFLLSPYAENWFFVGDRVWGYANHLGSWTARFWGNDAAGGWTDLLTVTSLMIAWVVASVMSWLGLSLGGWMRKVQR